MKTETNNAKYPEDLLSLLDAKLFLFLNLLPHFLNKFRTTDTLFLVDLFHCPLKTVEYNQTLYCLIKTDLVG